MTRSPGFVPRALLGAVLAASGCADLVGLSGDYREVAGAGGRAGTGSAGLGNGGGGMAPEAGESGTAGGAAGGSAGESAGGQSGTGESGGEGGTTRAGSGGVVAGSDGRAGAGAGGVSGTGGEAGMPAGSAGTAPNAYCGDGELDGAEVCDDGNTTSGDGCSAKCKVEKGWACNRAAPSYCTRPSCDGLLSKLCNGGDCCESPIVAGATFTQGPDPRDTYNVSFSSTVSDFRLDKYEVTVARFQKFVGAYDEWRGSGQPADDSGSHPNSGGTGWSSAWPLPSDAMHLKTSLQCDANYTWTEFTGSETLPINCVDWYTAFAFCVWDGGRLPTEAEFEYAAGGATPSIYPWGDAPVPTDTQDSSTSNTVSYANYNCMGDNSDPGICSRNDILDVGSKPDGAGPFRQEDLAGSMWEWEFDWSAQYPADSQVDYVGPPSGSFGFRVVRGGSWTFTEQYLRRASRSNNDPGVLRSDIGFRCARDL